MVVVLVLLLLLHLLLLLLPLRRLFAISVATVRGPPAAAGIAPIAVNAFTCAADEQQKAVLVALRAACCWRHEVGS